VHECADRGTPKRKRGMELRAEPPTRCPCRRCDPGARRCCRTAPPATGIARAGFGGGRGSDANERGLEIRGDNSRVRRKSIIRARPKGQRRRRRVSSEDAAFRVIIPPPSPPPCPGLNAASLRSIQRRLMVIGDPLRVGPITARNHSARRGGWHSSAASHSGERTPASRPRCVPGTPAPKDVRLLIGLARQRFSIPLCGVAQSALRAVPPFPRSP